MYLGEHMPVTIYQVADAATRDNRPEHLIFVWELKESKPVLSKNEIESYEAKDCGLGPLYGKRARLYSSHENAGRDRQVYSGDLRGIIRPWGSDGKNQGRDRCRGGSNA